MRGSMTMRSPPSSASTIRLPRRVTAAIRRPATRRRKVRGAGRTVIGCTGKRGQRTSRIVQPAIAATPRRMFSTSGSSGMSRLKHEIRISKSETNPKSEIQMSETQPILVIGVSVI